MNLGGLFGSLDSEWKKVISTLDKVAPNNSTAFLVMRDLLKYVHPVKPCQIRQ